MPSWGFFFFFIRQVDTGTYLKEREREKKKSSFHSVFHLAWKDPTDSHLVPAVEIKQRREVRKGGMELTVLPFSQRAQRSVFLAHPYQLCYTQAPFLYA